jgi:hypothetical protein
MHCRREVDAGEPRVRNQTTDLLNVIVSTLVLVDEQKDVDLNADASETAGDIEAEKAAAIERETERAEALAPAFDAGMRAAWVARASGNPSISLDDRDPQQNAMADALIQYLVSYGLAESGSRETEPLHYEYTVAVDWERLDALAAGAGLNLATMLG